MITILVIVISITLTLISDIIRSRIDVLSSLKTKNKESNYTTYLEINLPNLKIEEATKISKKLKKELMKEIKNYYTIQIIGNDIKA